MYKERKVFMAKVNVVGNVMVVTSKLKLEDLKKLQNYYPDSLCISDDNGIVYYKVCVGSEQSISQYGICFLDTTSDPNGYAACTLPLPSSVGAHTGAQLQNYIATTYGASLVGLNEIESRLESVIQDVLEKEEMIKSQITIGVCEGCRCHTNIEVENVDENLE